MAPLTQENRLLTINTPLGKDVLMLIGLTGQESMSRLFTYQIDLLSEKEEIAAKDIVGNQVSFSVRLTDGNSRYFNGFVSRFWAGTAESGLRSYRAEVVPWLWFLTRTADCRIFQEMTIPEIIEKIFQDLNFKDYDASAIKGAHPKWEYCVQYRETDFNFVSRLMEEEGIFYFFRHEENKHVLVLADQTGAYTDCPEKQVEHEYSAGSQSVTDRITRWEHRYEFRPGKWAQTDYYFESPSGTQKTPSNILMNRANSIVKLPGNDKYEIYDYPGGYARKEDGNPDTATRMQEEEVPAHIVHGASTCKTFTPGGKFTLSRHSSDWEVGKSYVITSILHAATEPVAAADKGTTGRYENSFTCIPDSVTFRPGRITPKPVVQGEQTAVVVGAKGEEIWPDKFGRIKVQFFWDREGKNDDNSSCWIRCMQTSAGKGWGTMFIPRVGQEVIVTYLEGDPSRPLIIGQVYNADQMPHYTLPDEKTKSYIKTCTSPGGEGFNELRFEDKKDKEQIFVHSQRNMDVRVLNDSLERTYGNRHQIIGWEKDGKKGGDQREMVYQDKRINIKRNQIEHIEGNMELLVGKGEAQDGGNWDLVVEKDKKELIEGDCHIHVKGGRSEKVDGTHSLTVGGDQQEKVGKLHALETGLEIHVKAGSKLIIEATMQVTFKGPGGFVDINPSGVVIEGAPAVLINSGGAAGSGSGSSPASAADAKKASPTKPSLADDAKPGLISGPPTLPAPPPTPVKPGPPKKPEEPPKPGPPKKPTKKTTFIAIELVDKAGKPVAGEAYEITLPGGEVRKGNLDDKGKAKIDGIDPGTCKVTFPKIHGPEWKKA